MKEKEIDFIARKYKKGLFSADKGWKRLNIAPVRNWKQMRIAAAVAGAIVLSATAAVLYHNIYPSETAVVKENKTMVVSKDAIKVIDFENTPLPTVIEKIKEVYGAEVTNIPENAEEYNLSLHYEGTASDLIATINEILNTDMEVKK